MKSPFSEQLSEFQGILGTTLRIVLWVLPEDYCNKDPCNFNTEMFVSKVGIGNPCPTLGQLLASRILYALLVGEKLANFWSTPSQLPTPWEVAGVFLAIVLWQDLSTHDLSHTKPKSRSGSNSQSKSRNCLKAKISAHILRALLPIGVVLTPQIYQTLERCKGHTHKGHREKGTECPEFQDFSGCFQGVFRVFSGYFREI